MTNNNTETKEYRFSSNGGCTRCDALHGRLYQKEGPHTRPHSNCNCQIVRRYPGPKSRDGKCNEEDMRYEFIDTAPIHHDGTHADDDHFELAHAFRIHCPDGEIIEADVAVEITYGELKADHDGALADAFAEALELIENLAATECKPCESPPAVA